MKFTFANQIAEMLNVVVDGDPNITLNQLAKIEERVNAFFVFFCQTLNTTNTFTRRTSCHC